MRAIALPVAIALAWCTHARAHGEVSQHGGVLQSVKEMSYELVTGPEGMVIHVADHGNPVATQGVVGRLVLTRPGGKREAPLKPDGAHALVVRGVVPTADEAVTLVLKMPSGREVVVRYPKASGSSSGPCVGASCIKGAHPARGFP